MTKRSPKQGDQVRPVDVGSLWAIATVLTVVDTYPSFVRSGNSILLRVFGVDYPYCFDTIQPESEFREAVHPRVAIALIIEVGLVRPKQNR